MREIIKLMIVALVGGAISLIYLNEYPPEPVVEYTECDSALVETNKKLFTQVHELKMDIKHISQTASADIKYYKHRIIELHDKSKLRQDYNRLKKRYDFYRAEYEKNMGLNNARTQIISD